MNEETLTFRKPTLILEGTVLPWKVRMMVAVVIFCDHNFLCLTDTLLFKIINYVFHGSKLQFAAPDDTLDGIQCPMGGYFKWNID